MTDYKNESDNNEIVIESTGSTLRYKPVDIKKLSGIEDLERYMLNTFKEQGWDCYSAKKITSGNQCFYPDITLMKNDEVFGFVECYIDRFGVGLLSKKLAQIMFILEQFKPKIFILTNGITFEMYFDGKYEGTMTIPISYDAYSHRTRLTKYCEAISSMMENKDGKNNK